VKLHYRIGWICALALASVVWGFRRRGVDRIPDKGPVIIASNHISSWDPVLLGLGCRREVHFMAKEELFRNPFLRWLITAYNAMPIRRGAPDSAALREARALLRRGEVLLMFPGGTRDESGEINHPKPGVGFLASAGRASVVPAYITGSNRMREAFSRTRRVEVAFGDPIAPGTEAAGDHGAFASLVARRIAELRTEVESA
jgi:1-acyl-sn-glycerol-3-phosphate acyltransferase